MPSSWEKDRSSVLTKDKDTQAEGGTGVSTSSTTAGEDDAAHLEENKRDTRISLEHPSEMAKALGNPQNPEQIGAMAEGSQKASSEKGHDVKSCGMPLKQHQTNGNGNRKGIDENDRQRCMCEFLYGDKLRALEEEAKVMFHWYTFLKEFLYHMLFPLSFPLVYLWEGGTFGLENRFFWKSPFMLIQLLYGVCFFFMFALSHWYLSPDIYITTAVWVVRNLVIATKYGFVSKPEMDDMRLRKLPWEVHMDRTLLLSWLNPIPARVLKRQLLLAAVRQNLVQCTDALRLVPGASQRTVCDIMHLMSITTTDEPLLEVSLQRRTSMQRGLLNGPTNDPKSSRTSQLATTKDVLAEANRGQIVDCPTCLARGNTEIELEARWINICMQDMKGRRRAIPKRRRDSALREARLEGDDQDVGDERKGNADTESDCECDLDGILEPASSLIVDGKIIRPGSRAPCPALDLPVLLFAVYLIQQSMSYLGRKRAVRSTLGNVKKVRVLSFLMAFAHAALPFIVRGIAGQPQVLGGLHWYNFVVSISSFVINFFAMQSNIMFMLAGVLDMRRRAFCAHLLNRLLKDGHYRPSRFMAGPGGAGSLTLSAGLDGSASRGSRWSSMSSSMSSSSSLSSLQRARPAPSKQTSTGSSGRSSYGLGLAIDFSHPESAIAWWTTRIIVQDFGLVFHMRVKYYASYFAVYCILLSLFLVIELLSSPGIRQVHIIVIVIYDLVVFGVLLGLMVFPAGETNELHHRHGETLIDKKLLLSMHLRKNRGAMSVEEKEQAEYAHEAISTLSQAVSWDNQITKVMIVGFSNGSQWVGVLLGAMGVAITIAAQQFTNKLKSSTESSMPHSAPPPLVTSR